MPLRQASMLVLSHKSIHQSDEINASGYISEISMKLNYIPAIVPVVDSPLR